MMIQEIESGGAFVSLCGYAKMRFSIADTLMMNRKKTPIPLANCTVRFIYITLTVKAASFRRSGKLVM